MALTSNICVQEGAANGSTGTVHALEYELLTEAGDGEDNGRDRNWWGAEKGYDKIVVTDLQQLPANAGLLLAIHVNIVGCEMTLRVCRTNFKR